MTNTRIANRTNHEIQLLSIKNGKYFVKVEGLEVPVTLNKYLYDRWIHQSTEGIEERREYNKAS